MTVVVLIKKLIKNEWTFSFSAKLDGFVGVPYVQICPLVESKSRVLVTFFAALQNSF